jgi:4-amino-4-deoxy-L-arabinose transferase-like glycosyltransferase
MNRLFARLSYRRHLLLLLLVVVAFSIRMAAVLALRDVHMPPKPGLGADPIEFNLLGLQLARGNGYTWESGQPTSFRAPGLPFLLSVIYSAFGEKYLFAYLAFCLLGAGSCLLIFLTAREVLGEKGGWAAGILSAIYYPHIYYTTTFYSETLFIFCLSLGLWTFIKHLRTGSLITLFCLGLILGYCTLTRPFAILLLPAFAALLFYANRQSVRRAATVSALYAVAFVAVVAPWTFRNYLVHGKVVLVSTNGGSTFYGANNDIVATDPVLLGSWVSTTKLPGRSLVEATENEYAHDRLEWKLGFDWVKANLSVLPKLLLAKIVRFFLPDTNTPNQKMKILNLLLTTPVLILCLIGIGQSWRKRKEQSLEWLAVHTILIATLLTGIIFHGDPRFRDGSMITVMLFAAYGTLTIMAAAKNQIKLPVSRPQERVVDA